MHRQTGQDRTGDVGRVAGGKGGKKRGRAVIRSGDGKVEKMDADQDLQTSDSTGTRGGNRETERRGLRIGGAQRRQTDSATPARCKKRARLCTGTFLLPY